MIDMPDNEIKYFFSFFSPFENNIKMKSMTIAPNINKSII